MLKFAYQGQPGPGPDNKVAHNHSADGEDDSCCEVCHHRKQELSREKTRVNRARSRSRERGRGYTSCSDTSTGFSEESRSRADTSSEDTSSLSCQQEERGRDTSRRDLTQCEVDFKENTVEIEKSDEMKTNNGKRGFSIFKMFQKTRPKEKPKLDRQCPVCGNEESESCCISNKPEEDQCWLDDNSRKQRFRKFSPKPRKKRSENDEFINAWRHNDGSMSSCEADVYFKNKYSNGDDSSPVATTRYLKNRRRGNSGAAFESDSECMTRHRRIQRTKSGGELYVAERNHSELSSKRRLLSRSCERLSTVAKTVRDEEQDFGRQFTANLPGEDFSLTEKSQRRYRKKNRKSKSCEKLNTLNSPQRKSYRNYDSDWETRSTVETTVLQQTVGSKHRRKARSCERLNEHLSEADDNLRLKEHNAKRKSLERMLGSKVIDDKSDPSSEYPTLITGTPSRPAVKEATVRKTKTLRSRCSPPQKGGRDFKSATLPRQRECKSDSEDARAYHTLQRAVDRKECNFNQNGHSHADVTGRRSKTLDRVSARSKDQSVDVRSHHCTAASRNDGCKKTTTQQQHGTNEQRQTEEAISYSEQLRLVATANREKLFNNGSAPDYRPNAGGRNRTTTSQRGTNSCFRGNYSSSRMSSEETPMVYELPCDTSAYEKLFPSNSKRESVLETNIDANVSLGYNKYTSLTSLSTTLSTTSEDSLDSGNGSMSDRGGKQVESAHSYSPIEAEKQRRYANTSRSRRNLPHSRNAVSVQETSDYESETSSTDATSVRKPKVTKVLPNIDHNSNVRQCNTRRELPATPGCPPTEYYRRPRIRYVDY
ncbi:hypothetical protein HOLleu_09569 [Holothuria leucospilota]|uniref:Uncharacterized protein n=1 Tax=Holothuria leucospilota TaxID=206669 RepID=A0A9Q1CD08_HOLLE|nr:hypothetical protein HOLleu_09569 [Holothuria leucospilota]